MQKLATQICAECDGPSNNFKSVSILALGS